MKYRVLLCVLLLTAMFLTGCGGETADDPASLQYYEALSELTTDSGFPTPALSTDDGLVYGMILQSAGGGCRIVRENGETVEITRDGAPVNATLITLTERALYTVERASAEDWNSRVLACYDLNGSALAAVNLTEIKPAGASGNYPGDSDAAGIGDPIPMTETDGGIAVLWGRFVLLFDESLALTDTAELPGTGYGIWHENGTLWVSHRDRELGRVFGKLIKSESGWAVAESAEQPDRFDGTSALSLPTIMAVREGWVYAWDQYGVFRWQIPAAADSDDSPEIMEDITDFVSAGVAGDRIDACEARWEDGVLHLRLSWADWVAGADPVYHLMHLAPGNGPKEDVLTLELVHAYTFSSVSEVVVEFNRTHEDVRIVVNDYSRFNSSGEYGAGLNRLRLDLETGVVKPDILLLSAYDYTSMARNMKDYFTDLTSLMSEDTVAADDLWPCVTNTLTVNGGLWGISPAFTLNGLVGRTDALNGMTSWTTEEFLDYAESIGEGAYLMDELGWSDGTYRLFGHQQWNTCAATGDFTDPTYLRYLEYFASLPENGVKLVQDTSGIADIMAGMADPDSVSVDVNAENLYHSGKIRLMNRNLTRPGDLMEMVSDFGVTSPAELSFIGYPVNNGGSGWMVDYNSTGIYTVPAACENPAAAWEFVTSVLKQTADDLAASEDDMTKYFVSLRDAQTAYFDSLELETFYFYAGGGVRGENVADRIVNGGVAGDTIDGMPGALVQWTEEMARTLTTLLENASLSVTTQPDEMLLAIVREEENRFFSGSGTAQSTAESIESRVGIYKAEQE